MSASAGARGHPSGHAADIRGQGLGPVAQRLGPCGRSAQIWPRTRAPGAGRQTRAGGRRCGGYWLSPPKSVSLLLLGFQKGPLWRNHFCFRVWLWEGTPTFSCSPQMLLEGGAGPEPGVNPPFSRGRLRPPVATLHLRFSVWNRVTTPTRRHGDQHPAFAGPSGATLLSDLTPSYKSPVVTTASYE